MMNKKTEIKAPSFIKLVLEVRTIAEAAGFALSYPVLQTAPKGDGNG